MMRVVVVTGAGAGIGRATAAAFARAGANVALLGRDAGRLETARRDIEMFGTRVLAIPLDVANADEVEAAAERVEREFGTIDVWVNNAMATVFSRAADITADEYRRVTDVTYLGTVHGTLAALKRMRVRDAGVIVQIGSALAYRSIPLQAPYCAAKFAVRGFTDSLRSELLHDKSRVRITMVQLSAFNTPQFDWARSHMPRRAQPVPPIFQPELAAEAIVYAAQNPRRELWVGFPAVRAIVSQLVAPGLSDRLAARLAYESQMTSEPRAANAPNNLLTPVPGNYGAHGRFEAKARSRNWFIWMTLHRAPAFIAIVLIAIIGWALAA